MLLLGTAAMCLAFVSSAAAATTIETISAWDGATDFAGFGKLNGAPTYGQTITPPASDRVLQDFSFEMWLPTGLTFRGEVYAWDAVENRATGSSLWESAPMTTSDSSVFERVTFSTGGLLLQAGQPYVLFATALKDNPQSNGTWGYLTTDTYPGGMLVFAHNSPFEELFTSSWNGIQPALDFAFSASFTPAYTISIISPIDGSSWTAGKTVPVMIELRGDGDTLMTDADAVALARACGVTVSATGDQSLTQRCMKYNRKTDQFTYSWRLARNVTGASEITFSATDAEPVSVSVTIG